MAIEQLEIGTKITWKDGRGRGDRKTLTGRISGLDYQDVAHQKMIIDTEDPDDGLTISVDNATDEYERVVGNKWFYASQIVRVG